MAEEPTVLRDQVRVYEVDLFVLEADPLALGLLAIGRERMARRARNADVMPVSISALARDSGHSLEALEAALWRLTRGLPRGTEFNPHQAFSA